MVASHTLFTTGVGCSFLRTARGTELIWRRVLPPCRAEPEDRADLVGAESHVERHPFRVLFEVEQAIVVRLAEPADAEPIRVALIQAARPRESARLRSHVPVAPRDVRQIAVTKVD